MFCLYYCCCCYSFGRFIKRAEMPVHLHQPKGNRQADPWQRVSPSMCTTEKKKKKKKNYISHTYFCSPSPPCKPQSYKGVVAIPCKTSTGAKSP